MIDIKKITSPALSLKNNISPMPSEWIEQNRYVQKHVSVGMEGNYNWTNTPYMREIVDHLDPYSPVTHITLMKGIRTGGTFVLVHNGCPYIIKIRPANIMLMSANKELARKTIEGVDDGIDGCEIRGCDIRSIIGKSSGNKSNTTGDTLEGKKFAGGYTLFNFGGQSVDNMRQVTASIIMADEIDAYKYVSKEGGDFLEVMEDRASDAGAQKKIVKISSPRLLETSPIYKAFLEGDQRVYYVPCPCCGEFIELVWNERNENNTRYGVIFDVIDGEVIEKSVRYRCGKCEQEFNEKKHKMNMLNAGYWKPTIDRQDKTNVSYRISALYAPITMDTWYAFAKRYQKAFPRGGVKDHAKMQSFTNSILGMPYKQEGMTIKSTQLQNNRRDYKIYECPFELSKKDGNGEIIIISLSCDLNGWEHDGRIDYEIVAHSEKGATYSIDAGSVGTFIPKVEKNALAREGVAVGKMEYERTKYTYRLGVENSIWDEFEKIIEKRYGKINRKLSIIAIDVGQYTDLAKEFISRIRNKGYRATYAIMGEKEETFQTQDKTISGHIYKKTKQGDVYLLNVNVIKDKLASYIQLEDYIDDAGQRQQSENFMNFPEYDTRINKYTYRNYFAHYEAEHKIKIEKEGVLPRFMWVKKKQGIQNHFFDVAVYTLFCKILVCDFTCSNDNPFKKKYYKSQAIAPTWVNACRLIKEASIEYNSPLS